MSRTFTFLGTGTSVGIPMVGCECGTCLSTDPRNQRWRCSVVLQTPSGTILIDTSPEMRLQLLRAEVKLIHAVLLTHYHADHLYGLDDIRVFPHRLGGPLPVYCTAETEAIVRRVFAYAFPELPDETGEGPPPRPASFVPSLRFERVIEGQPFQVLGEQVLPIPLQHAQFNVLGFRVGDVAYCTDVSYIPESSYSLLAGLDVLVLDALRHRPHPAHLSIDQALAVVERLRPRRAYFTHISHDVEHEETEAKLPSHVRLAYDGLQFDF
ncbi:MAG TPA: MBL fold metallo-hydrolase [Gemmatales bacterium]|nr:MBL fold metallo-hydrolase [Gemmatales bacterium]HMP59669.1 MBL fold metallo-hydrolase [Gemmatales bacterium]